MTLFKRLFILFCLTIIIILIGKIVPKLLHSPNTEASSSHAKSISKKKPGTDTSSLFIEDYRQVLFDSIATIAQIKKTNNFKQRIDSSWNIFFPKGKSLIEYALVVKNICEKIEVPIKKGWMTTNNPKFIRFNLSLPQEDLVINIRYGRSMIQGSGKLCVLLTRLNKIQPKDLALINAIPWPKSILVDPNTPNEKLKIYAKAITQDCLLLRLPMEPYQYPYKKPGKNALFIHYEQKKIHQILKQKHTNFNNVSGFGTIVGDRAIENKNMLNNIFQYFSAHNLGYIDLTGSQRSLAIPVSREFNVLCRKSSAKKINPEQAEKYLRRHIRRAIRRGESLFILPYDFKTLTIIDKKIQQLLKSDERIEMITFSQLEKF